MAVPAFQPGSQVSDLLTATEVAAALRVSKMTVYRLLKAGELKSVRIGRSFRVPRPALRDLVGAALA